MKTQIIILYLIACSFTLKAQNTDSAFCYQDDYILIKLIPLLPQGWTFLEKDNEFIIQRNDSVYIVDRKNLKINRGENLKDDTIIKYGTKTQSKIIFKYENRWSYEQNIIANSNNMIIYEQLKKLPEKYKITDLADKSKSTRETIVYFGKTDEEKELIKQFEKEKNVWMSKIITKPNYHTEKYSLFLKSTYGCNDDFYSVYPSVASLQLYTILTLFFELTEKSSQ